MHFNEEIDPVKNKLQWSTNRKSLNIEKYKEEIINQGKCLCGHYIRARLRRAGVLNRKVIQRLRAILEPSSNIVYELFPTLNSMGEELERMYPRLYINVSRQLSSEQFGELQDGDQAPILLNLIAKELFKMDQNQNNNNCNTNMNINHNNINYNINNNSNITWGKIISLFAVCGGLAIDCVRQGHYDYLQYLIDGMTEIFEDDLIITWLIDNDGWLGLQNHVKYYIKNIKFSKKLSIIGWLTIFIIISSIIYLITSIINYIGCHLYSYLF